MEDAAPYREFIREMTLRIERAMREFGREMARMRTENRAFFEVMQGEFRELRQESQAQRDEIRDLREESRAQTQALLRILDRLDNGGTAPA